MTELFNSILCFYKRMVVTHFCISTAAKKRKEEKVWCETLMVNQLQKLSVVVMVGAISYRKRI